MLKSVCIIVIAAAVLAGCGVAWAVSPTVSNVTASQRTDASRIVDIYYDVADPDSSTVAVGVRISDDGGTTWNKVYAITTSGDIGRSVAPGTGKHIVWDTVMDAPTSYGVSLNASVVASDTGGVYIGDVVQIPVGSFEMGKSTGADDQTYGQASETPQHSVYLCAYRIGKYEVTRGEYKQFVQAQGYTTSSYWSTEGWTWKASNGRTHPDYWDAPQTWSTTTFTQTDSYPVVGVTYYEAEAFANWCGCRVPTEAEWEKAARGTGTQPNVYPWSNVWDAQKCNNLNDTQYTGSQTAPVGSYSSGASPYGCMDMAGNAYEWCKDRYDSAYYGLAPQGDWFDPQGPGTGAYRVLRGGAWNVSASYCRCASRSSDSVIGHLNCYGFRLAR